MSIETASPECPRCGSRAVEVTPGRASACSPFPPLEALRCTCCENTGTRLRLRERVIVQWTHEG